MKNQRVIYEALLAGETLTRKETGYDHKVKLNENGFVIWADAGTAAIKTFDDYGFWQIYKEPKWYENIPDGGVLCWQDYRDGERGLHPVIVRSETDMHDNSNYSPLTKQEIQVFMDNIPEAG